MHAAHGVRQAVGGGASRHIIGVQGTACAAAGSNGEVVHAVLHCPLLVCACNEVLEAGGVGGVAGDGNVNALSLHDCNAFENVVRAVALHLCLLTVGVRCFADYVELAGVEVILRLHISEAVDAGNDHGGILAEAVEDNAKGLFANLVCRTRDADCAFSGCERLMAGKESKALCFVL